MAAALAIHTILHTRIPPGRARSQHCSTRWSAGGWICKYGHLSKRILMVCTPDYFKLPRGDFLCTGFPPLTRIFYVRKAVRNLCVKLQLSYVALQNEDITALFMILTTFIVTICIRFRGSLFCNRVIKVGKLLFHSRAAFVRCGKKKGDCISGSTF